MAGPPSRRQLAATLLLTLIARAAAKTYQYDTAALLTFYNGVANPEVLEGWIAGDPCGYNAGAAPPTPWLGVTCNGQTAIDSSTGATYDQVTGLSLKGLGLAGSAAFGEDYRALNYLASVDLSDNSLNSSLPDFSSAYAIKSLDVSNNRFMGTIPSGWNSLAKLSVINLANNQLSGPLPDAVAMLNNVTRLDVSHNRFTGPLLALPSSGENAHMNFSHNAFSGTLAADFFNRANLSAVDVSSNQLSGPAPIVYDFGGKYPGVLDDNYFTGRPVFVRTPTGVSSCIDATERPGQVTTPSTSSNCFTFAGSDCPATPQRPAAQCAAFCDASSASGPCAGHGVCSFKGSAPACTCDPFYMEPPDNTATCARDGGHHPPGQGHHPPGQGHHPPGQGHHLPPKARRLMQ